MGDTAFKHQGERVKGFWGWSGEDKPPWNIGPESTIAFSPACFFDVPEDFEVPENPEFRCFAASNLAFWNPKHPDDGAIVGV